MKQGQVAPKGKWTGNPHGTTKPAPSMILPDPDTRFSKTATRLEALAGDHPMADWLRFLARLSRAQHMAAMALLHVRDVQSDAARTHGPPLAAANHCRSPIWRDALAIVLQNADHAGQPQAATDVIGHLRRRNGDQLEDLASAFLGAGLTSASDAGAAHYIAAALQVYFSRMAARQDVSLLRSLGQPAQCPCCGSPPVSSIVTASGTTPGARYLTCSLCATEWNHARAICINCGSGRTLALQRIEGASEAIKAETCGECRTYAKILDQRQDAGVDPFADDLASLGLDVLVGEAGFARSTPNLMLLVG